mgnify:FL=1
MELEDNKAKLKDIGDKIKARHKKAGLKDAITQESAERGAERFKQIDDYKIPLAEFYERVKSNPKSGLTKQGVR